MKYLAAAGFAWYHGVLVSFAICFDCLAQGHMINTTSWFWDEMWTVDFLWYLYVPDTNTQLIPTL